MEKFLNTQEPINNTNNILFPVHVICWDGVPYDRTTTLEEIYSHLENGYLKEDGFSGITFDFRSSKGL